MVIDPMYRNDKAAPVDSRLESLPLRHRAPAIVGWLGCTINSGFTGIISGLGDTRPDWTTKPTVASSFRIGVSSCWLRPPTVSRPGGAGFGYAVPIEIVPEAILVAASIESVLVVGERFCPRWKKAASRILVVRKSLMFKGLRQSPSCRVHPEYLRFLEFLLGWDCREIRLRSSGFH